MYIRLLYKLTIYFSVFCFSVHCIFYYKWKFYILLTSFDTQTTASKWKAYREWTRMFGNIKKVILKIRKNMYVWTIILKSLFFVVKRLKTKEKIVFLTMESFPLKLNLEWCLNLLFIKCRKWKGNFGTTAADGKYL